MTTPRPQQLIASAHAAREHAHAPYSKFRAGAVVLGDDGTTAPGVIVENVSLGLAMCAERVALFTTVARGAGPVALALVAPSTRDDTTWPCGACLQVALELGGPDMAVYVGGIDDDSPIHESTVRTLLPRGPYIDH